MKRLALIAFAILALAAGIFFGPAPAWVEASMNRIDGKPLIAVSDHARRLHATLTIVDLHADTLLWRRSVLDWANRGHVDLPRLEAGNVALQVFSSVTKTPRGLNYDRNVPDTDNVTPLAIAQLQPVRTWNSLAERSLWHSTKLDRAVAASQGELLKVADPKDLDTLLAIRKDAVRWPTQGAPYSTPVRGRAPVGAMLSIEGLHDLEGKAENLERLHAAGFRMASLTHFFDDELAGSMHGIAKGGVTPFGRGIVRRMEALGMIVDVAHCSHACVADLIAMARRPLVSSHGGVQATCKVNRNLTDDEIRGIARTGGVIGVGYWDAAVCDTSPRAAAKAMRHIRDLVGIEYVGLGSDFDGSTTTRFDTSQLVQITQAMLDEGFSDDDVRAAMGGNALRVIRAGIVPWSGG